MTPELKTFAQLIAERLGLTEEQWNRLSLSERHVLVLAAHGATPQK